MQHVRIGLASNFPSVYFTSGMDNNIAMCHHYHYFIFYIYCLALFAIIILFRFQRFHFGNYFDDKLHLSDNLVVITSFCMPTSQRVDKYGKI